MRTPSGAGRMEKKENDAGPRGDEKGNSPPHLKVELGAGEKGTGGRKNAIKEDLFPSG